MSCNQEDRLFVVMHFFFTCILKTLHTYISKSCACMRLRLEFVKCALIAMYIFLLCKWGGGAFFLHQILAHTLDHSKGTPPLLSLSGIFISLNPEY